MCVQKQLSIFSCSTLFSCARIYFSHDNYSTNEHLNNQEENKHTNFSRNRIRVDKQMKPSGLLLFFLLLTVVSNVKVVEFN